MRISPLLAFFAAVPTWALSAAAGPLVPTKPSQIVTLITTATDCSPGIGLDQQVLPDGSIAPFTIPSGRVFVVTEVDWLIIGATPSGTMTFGLRADTPAATLNPTFFSDYAVGDGAGNGGNVRSVANAVVASGATICASGSGDLQEAHVRGFLAKDR